MKRNYGIWALGIGFFLLNACAAPTPSPAAPIRLATTDLAEPLLADLTTAYQAAHPDANFITGFVPLSTLGAELIAGRWDAGLTSVPATAAFATPIGYVPFAVVVNSSNPLAGLSVAQLRAVLAGRITDWAQVGGSAGAVQVITREGGSDGARAFMTALGGTALGGTALGSDAPITSNALVAPAWDAMRALVSQNPAAVGYLPQAELNAQVKPVALDAPLRVLLVMVAPAEPRGPIRDFLAWAQSAEGQAVIQQRYEAIR